MGKEYYHQSVDVILEKGSDLYRRIAALAEAQGHSFESEVESAVEASLWHHMVRNVECMERYLYKADKSTSERGPNERNYEIRRHRG